MTYKKQNPLHGDFTGAPPARGLQAPLGYGQEYGDPAEQIIIPSLPDVSSLAVRKIARALRDPNSPGAQADLAAASPEERRLAGAVRTIRDAAAPVDVLYFKTEGIKIISSSIGPNPLMRGAEARTAETFMIKAPAFEPQVFTFAGGPPQRIDVDAALAIPNGGPLPVGTIFPWVGEIWRITSSVLQSQPGINFILNKQLGPNRVMSLVCETQRATEWVGLTCCHGVLVGGLPRLTIPDVTVQAVASGDYFLTNSLPSPTYNTTVRFMQTGDRAIEGFLSMLE